MSLTVHDYEQIRATIARYAHAIDAGRTADVAATFTKDGTIELAGVPTENPLGGVWRGREAVERFGALIHQAEQGRSRHWPQIPVIDEIALGQVRVTSYAGIVRLGDAGTPSLAMTGIYRDELRKVGEQWLFASREFQADLA